MNLAPSTIDVRLAAVRRLAYQASDTGLLSRDLAAESAASKEQSAWAFASALVDRRSV
jgi:hypothetical protein